MKMEHWLATALVLFQLQLYQPWLLQMTCIECLNLQSENIMKDASIHQPKISKIREVVLELHVFPTCFDLLFCILLEVVVVLFLDEAVLV